MRTSARARRFVQEADRSLYRAAHVLLRLSLSRHAPLDPRDWRFVQPPLARPEPDGERCPGGQALRFSLSHSRGIVACALATQAPVGIDCESHRPLPDALDLARRFFAPSESDAVAAAPPGDARGQRLALFYTYWTLKEAYLKATGEGLSANLQGFAFHLSGQRPIGIALDADPAELAAPADWAFALLRVGATGTLAAALPAPGGARFQVYAVSPSGSPPPCEPAGASRNARVRVAPPIYEHRAWP